MAHPIVTELRAKRGAALAGLRRQLDGMPPYLERTEAPGQWTAREVASPW